LRVPWPVMAARGKARAAALEAEPELALLATDPLATDPPAADPLATMEWPGP
jgi:hypothetical protein